MLSLEYLESAVGTFLRTCDPEVICISGKWGVGKTFEWDRLLKKAVAERSLGMDRYSYVTLFGINSLDDLKHAVFENTVTGDNLTNPSDENSYAARIRELKKVGKSGSVLEGVASKLLGSWATKAVLSATFMTVRDQIVCFDDIERAGSGLDTKDVLGLASFLREQRGCKVVLLLNQDELGDSRATFEASLEKVADAAFEFKPTPHEAVTVALDSESEAARLMVPYALKLKITNIRVLRKILRIVEQLTGLLENYDEAVKEQAAATAVLSGVSVFQPHNSVPLEFIKNYNIASHLMAEPNDVHADEEHAHHLILQSYQFQGMDELDEVVIDGVRQGYVDEASLLERAATQQARLRSLGQGSEFSRVWNDLYHGSLVTDDHVFLNALFNAAMSEVEYLHLTNINSAITILREFDGEENANALVEAFVDASERKGLSHLKLENHPFADRDNLDAKLVATMSDRYTNYVDERDPFDVLVRIGAERTWREDDARLLGGASVEELVRLLEKLRGQQVMECVDALLRLGRADKTAEAFGLRAKLESAFNEIAEKSPIRARKIANLNVTSR